MEQVKENNPHLFIIADTISKKSVLQKKAIEHFITKQDAVYFERAEAFAKKFLAFLKDQDVELDYAVDSYLKMCKDVMMEQIAFKKTGQYPASSKKIDEIVNSVYLEEKPMAAYMYGLALSQFFWPNHYALFDFFIAQSKLLTDVNTYLEIGPGHGFFLVESMSIFPKAKIKAIDISPTSIKMTGSVVDFFSESKKYELALQNVFELHEGLYDYIVMCEVMEHLLDPIRALIQLRDRLSPNGRLFITTCANLSAIDHVYLYTSAPHIRREISKAGYTILSELILPAGDIPKTSWEDEGAEINYAAMLERSGATPDAGSLSGYNYVSHIVK